MARSLLRQLTQVANTATYDDQVVDVNLGATAEPTVSGSLESDLNIVRTLLKQTKGTTDWYSGLGVYFDPTDTDSGSAQNKDLNLNNLRNNSLDAKTMLIGVQDVNAGAGYTVASGTDGVLVSLTTPYAKPDDRRGLPIFASTANNGSYWDEGGDDNICRIDVINMDTDSEFVDSNGNTVYAKFQDGADHSGTGDGTDVYVKFYADGNEYTLENDDVTSIGFVYPVRRVMNAVAEYEWLRTGFASGWGGDWELVDDIHNLWSYTGAADSVSSTTGSWANTSAYYALQADPSSLHSAIDALNDSIGNRTYTQANYITSGEEVSLSIDKLDMEVKSLADSISAGVGDKYIEEPSSNIDRNTAHTLPYGISYTPDSTTGQEGKNMDVYVDGQLLAADTGANGANADRDYAETSSTSITFRFKVHKQQNITYVVRQ